MEKSSIRYRISSTAQQSGYGSASRFKRVTGLTTEECDAVQEGTRIFFRAARVSGKGSKGTFWRVAKVFGKTIGPRVPTSEEVVELRAQTQLL